MRAGLFLYRFYFFVRGNYLKDECELGCFYFDFTFLSETDFVLSDLNYNSAVGEKTVTRLHVESPRIALRFQWVLIRCQLDFHSWISGFN